MSEILNMPFLGYGFLEISKPQNPQDINKFQYLMNEWVIISTNIQSDYIQVIHGTDCSPGTHTSNRQNNWKFTDRVRRTDWTVTRRMLALIKKAVLITNVTNEKKNN
jgi:hypothetical protein